MIAARFISFWVGFCSLSLEIAWVRLYGYANLSTPKAFASVLISYLLGIAFGAYCGKWVCQHKSNKSLERIALTVLACGSIVAVTGPWMVIAMRELGDENILSLIAIFLTAGVLAILFPITHHLGAEQSDSARTKNTGKGRNFSKVYTLNVIGAAMGPLITGYFLLDKFTIVQIFSLLSLVISVTALLVWMTHGIDGRPNFWAMTFILSSFIVGGYYGKLSIDSPYEFSKYFAKVGGFPVVQVAEGRHGIITISERKMVGPSKPNQSDFLVYGGNVYDGRVNVDLELNTNGLQRPLALHVFNPDAKRVLILGLSIGSWLTVLEGFPGIESIDVVEINSDYIALAENYLPQKSSLMDKRVSLYIDDARRWLKYHPDRKYDIILMNTTWHWRANAAMLLSQEMMYLISRHLTEKGIVAFNATGSIDAFYTARSVFKEVRRYENFIYGASWDAFSHAKNEESWNVLRNVRINGSPGFHPDSLKVQEFSKVPIIEWEDDLKAASRPPEIITDNNMLVEYKFGKKN